MEYIFDTTIFSHLPQCLINEADVPLNAPILSTTIQPDELGEAPEAIKDKLLSKFAELAPTIVPTESFAFDISHWNQAKWSDGKTCEAIKADLDLVDKREKNNLKDAMIVEVAIRRGVTLVTSDENQSKIAKRHGATVLFIPRRQK